MKREKKGLSVNSRLQTKASLSSCLAGLACAMGMTQAASPMLLPSAVESEMLWPYHAAALARATGEAWDAAWAKGQADESDAIALAWQNGAFRLMATGPSDAIWRHWQASQGMRIAPGAWLGYTLQSDTREAWRNGLGLGVDGELAFGPRLRVSSALQPRVWNSSLWQHNWGAAFRLNAENAKGTSLWFGAQWPWENREPVLPQVFMTLQPDSRLGLQGRYDFEQEKTSIALNMAFAAQGWLGIMPDLRRIGNDARYSISASEIRLRWRKQAYAAHWNSKNTWWRFTWDKAWVEGETHYDFFGKEQATGFADMLQMLKAARHEKDVTGLFITLRGMRADMAMAQEAGQALDALRKQGKKIVIYTDIVTPITMLLGAHATHFIVHPQGYVMVSGFSAQLPFYRKALDKIGVEVQFVRHGKYKAFDEPFTRTEASPEFRFNTQEWLHDLGQAYRNAVAAGRRLDTAKVSAFMARGELSLDSAMAFGLIDTLLSEHSALQWLNQASGQRISWRQPGIQVAVPGEPPFGQRPRLAVVHLSGTILDDGSAAWPFGGKSGITPKPVTALLHRLKRDASVKGVVLRLDSPGGSALASDIITEAIDSLRESGKPVVLSVGGMAASGGYYLGTACDRIVAEPTSMVGSIGVVWGKLNADSLYAKLGITHETLKTAPHADAMSTTRGLSPQELAKIQNHLDGFYATFIARVKKARKLDSVRLDSVAEGRVFMGERAKANGLIDSLGGLETALQWTQSLAGLSVRAGMQAVEVLHFDPNRSSDGLWKGSWAAWMQGASRESPASVPGWLSAGITWFQAWNQPRVWAVAPLELQGQRRP